jgi:hypothetical protein
MSPDYYALFDQEIMAGSGVSYDVDVFQSISFSIANSSTAPSQRSFQVSQAVRFLKTVSAVTRLQADLNSLGSSKAKFGNHMYAGYAIQVNGVQYPQQPTTKVFDACLPGDSQGQQHALTLLWRPLVMVPGGALTLMMRRSLSLLSTSRHF